MNGLQIRLFIKVTNRLVNEPTILIHHIFNMFNNMNNNELINFYNILTKLNKNIKINLYQVCKICSALTNEQTDRFIFAMNKGYSYETSYFISCNKN